MTIISILRSGRYVIPESTRLSAVVLQLAIIFSVVPLCSSVQLLCQTFLDVPLSRCIFARKGRQEGENGRHVLRLSSFPSRGPLLFVKSHSSSVLAFVREKSAGK